MRYRRLGRTGFDVSEISLGTVEIGMPYGIAEDGEAPPPDEAEASKLLHSALDLGVNLIDTARAYGESEAIIGRVVAGPPERIHSRVEGSLLSRPESRLRGLAGADYQLGSSESVSAANRLSST